MRFPAVGRPGQACSPHAACHGEKTAHLGFSILVIACFPRDFSLVYMIIHALPADEIGRLSVSEQVLRLRVRLSRRLSVCFLLRSANYGGHVVLPTLTRTLTRILRRHP